MITAIITLVPAIMTAAGIAAQVNTARAQKQSTQEFTALQNKCRKFLESIILDEEVEAKPHPKDFNMDETKYALGIQEHLDIPMFVTSIETICLVKALSFGIGEYKFVSESDKNECFAAIKFLMETQEMRLYDTLELYLAMNQTPPLPILEMWRDRIASR